MVISSATSQIVSRSLFNFSDIDTHTHTHIISHPIFPLIPIGSGHTPTIKYVRLGVQEIGMFQRQMFFSALRVQLTSPSQVLCQNSFLSFFLFYFKHKEAIHTLQPSSTIPQVILLELILHTEPLKYLACLIVYSYHDNTLKY